MFAKGGYDGRPFIVEMHPAYTHINIYTVYLYRYTQCTHMCIYICIQYICIIYTAEGGHAKHQAKPPGSGYRSFTSRPIDSTMLLLRT